MTSASAGAVPALFVSHGAPTLLLEGGPTCDFLASLGPKLGKPKAVLCVSAHWETDAPAVSAATAPETIHDFYGFPKPLYDMRYPAPGSPEVARRVQALLQKAGLACSIDPGRGLDHGAWVPMKLMYPQNDVPILQLSIQPERDPAHHLALGRALAPLRDEGVLVLASGSAIHNLRALRWGGTGPQPWATNFATWLNQAVTEGAVDRLTDYRRQTPDGAMAHPTDEHFLPLFVAMGAAGAGKGEVIFDAFTHGNLGMQAYRWG